MGFIDELVEGVASDVFSAVSERLSIGSTKSIIETCCRDLRWTIDNRLGPGKFCLYFDDPIVRLRMVLVSIADRGATVSFTVASPINMRAKEVPAAVLGYVLERNCHLFASWQIFIGGDGAAVFSLNYRALTPGLNPGIFKLLCENMVAEARDFDEKIQRAGLLP